jgi:hypothetical protein
LLYNPSHQQKASLMVLSSSHPVHPLIAAEKPADASSFCLVSARPRQPDTAVVEVNQLVPIATRRTAHGRGSDGIVLATAARAVFGRSVVLIAPPPAGKAAAAKK